MLPLNIGFLRGVERPTNSADDGIGRLRQQQATSHPASAPFAAVTDAGKLAL